MQTALRGLGALEAMAVLTHRWVSSGALAGKAAFSDARVAVVMHGIMGSGRNWMTPAKKLVDAFPSWKVLLVDHRGHGERARDAPPPPPHTIDACAADLEATIAHATGARAPTPSAPSALLACGGARIVCGHSFGGKVALALAQQASLHELWLIDSMPGARPDRHGSEAIAKVLAALRAVPARHADRDAFVAALRAEGVAEPLGRWLAMSLKREDDGQMRYPVDLDAIDGLLDDYFALDLWGALPGANRAHVVIGEKSEVFAGPDRERVRALAAEDPRLEVHLVEGAGHWVHVEKPSALAALFG